MLFRVWKWAALVAVALFFAVPIAFFLSSPAPGIVVAVALIPTCYYTVRGLKRIRARRRDYAYHDPDIEPGTAETRRFNDPIDPQEARWLDAQAEEQEPEFNESIVPEKARWRLPHLNLTQARRAANVGVRKKRAATRPPLGHPFLEVHTAGWPSLPGAQTGRLEALRVGGTGRLLHRCSDKDGRLDQQGPALAAMARRSHEDLG